MKSTRKKFLQQSSTGMLLFLTGSFNSLAASSTVSKGVVSHKDEGDTYLIGPRRAPVTVKFSKSKHGVTSFSFCIEDIAPGDRIPVHKHLHEDEFIFIESGSGILTMDNEEIAVTAGSSAYIPKKLWHGLKNEGNENLRMLFGYSPAGFEDYFAAFGTKKGEPERKFTFAEMDVIDKKFGIVYKRN